MNNSVYGGQPLRSSNPAVNIIKTIGASPLFLAAAILQSVATLFSIVGSILAMGNLSETMISFFDQMGADVTPEFYDIMDSSLSSSAVSGAISGAAMPILIAVALWITWASSRNLSTGNVSASGFTIMKVIAIIRIVVLAFAALIVLLVGVLFAILGVSGATDEIIGEITGSYPRGSGGVVSGLAVAFVVLFLLIFAVSLIYYILQVKTLNRIRVTAATGVPDDGVSSGLVVFLFVFGIFGIIGGLANFAFSWASGISGLLSGVYLILLGILLKRYKQEMTALRYSMQQQPASPTPPAGYVGYQP